MVGKKNYWIVVEYQNKTEDLLLSVSFSVDLSNSHDPIPPVVENAIQGVVFV